jgi:hypothetical protein
MVAIWLYLFAVFSFELGIIANWEDGGKSQRVCCR